MDEANLLNWAGVTLGKAEVYRLYLSIKKLAESLPADVGRLRYFGQISTTGSGPYIVVEGLSPEDEESIDENKQVRYSFNRVFLSIWNTYIALYILHIYHDIAYSYKMYPAHLYTHDPPFPPYLP